MESGCSERTAHRLRSLGLITPEEAAEILGIDLVLLERRIKGGRLFCREIDGEARIGLEDVLALKEAEDKQNALMAEIYEDMEGVDSPPNGLERKM